MIDIAELLKDAKSGLKLYSPIFGLVIFDKIALGNYPIIVKDSYGTKRSFTKYGLYSDHYSDAECMIYPSRDCQTWEGWKAPTEPKFKVNNWIIFDRTFTIPIQIVEVNQKNGVYVCETIEGLCGNYSITETDKNYHLWTIQDARDGDVLICESGWTCIFKKLNEDTFDSHCFISASGDVVPDGGCCHTLDPRINGKLTPATTKQRIAFFNKLNNSGYKWNSCKKKLEPRIEHKFKVRDWIIHNDGSSIIPIQIYDLKKDRYLTINTLGSKGEVMLTYQDRWRLWSINDAKPGDILNANGAVFIYKKHNKDYVYHYCGINLGNEFVIGTDDSIWNANNEVYPATQEQKDLLFKRIKEAGYTWDLNSNTLTRKTKFKIGDWIISKEKDRFYQITDIRGKKYFYNNTVKYDYINIADDLYDLWTIDDAKPGDILCYKDEISIYKNSIMDFLDKFAGFQYYCCYDGKILVTDGFYPLTEKKDKFDIYPATKEQIETLFSYMTSAGYIWDFDNKTLKETKFKIGNWIVNNEDKNVSQITEIICDKKDPNILYGYVHTNGFFANTFEDNYHLWAIKDAKNGDILSAKIDGDDYILLFKQIKDGWIETYGHYYITIDKCCVPSQLFCRDYQGTFHPATQEQCKTLFKKMHDEGYDWDSDKKILTNRNKPHYDIANFHAGMPVLVRDNNDGVWQYLLFSHLQECDNYDYFRFIAGGVAYAQCIPFNKDTKHLLGTTDMCDEQYINW